MAMLSDEVGAEKTAAEAREVGCENWQALPGEENGQPVTRIGCVRSHLRAYLEKYGSDVLLASDTIQKDRNEQAKALEAVQAAVEKHGGGAVLQALGQLGLRAALGASTGEQRHLESGSADPAPDPRA